VDVADNSSIGAFKFDLIDPGGIDEASLRRLAACPWKVELLLLWIHNLLVDSVRDGTLDVPPPVMSNILKSLELGKTAFYEAVRISEVPFPFPYTQATDLLLVLHCVVTVIVTPQWSNTLFWTAFFVFLQVFILWSLNLIASELEVPFGTDPNDLNGECLQTEMNAHLLLLFDASKRKTPTLRPNAHQLHRLDKDVVMMSFSRVWQNLGASEVAESCRKGQALVPASTVLLKSSPSLMSEMPGAHGGGVRRSARFDLVDAEFASRIGMTPATVQRL